MDIEIKLLSKIEHDAILNAAAIYGDSFANAHDLIIFCWSFIATIKHEAFVFTLFIGQFQKSINLCLMSALRNHEIQFNMMLRYALESAAIACYSLYNPNQSDYSSTNDNGCLIISGNVKSKAYKWLDENCSKFSNSMKSIKKTINESFAHSSVLGASNNISFDGEKYGSTYFDEPNKLMTQHHLWWVGDVIVGVLRNIKEIIAKYPLIKVVADFDERLSKLEFANIRIKQDLIANPKFAKWI